MSLPEPPTENSIVDARRLLNAHWRHAGQLDQKIDAAERQLAEIIAESRRAIEELRRDRSGVEYQISLTQAYLSPMRRLPHEILRHIFLLHFEDAPCCAWVLASVCSQWRKLALNMPRLWSKIRLETTQNASADTIRLWLERSGTRIPLDIEITLRTGTSEPTVLKRRRLSSPSQWWTHGMPGAAFVQLAGHGPAAVQILQAHHSPPILPPILSASPGSSSPSPRSSPSKSNASTRLVAHWGHIAIFYLVEQMHRWERFVFRFDRQFSSMHSLKSIMGDALILKEFEISSLEPPSFGIDWSWLPSAEQDSPHALPQLTSVNLQNVPFKWYAPMLSMNLRSLCIRALPTLHLTLDRIAHTVANNPNLETLSLHFHCVLPPILPLSAITLPRLKEFTLGGHYLLGNLVDSLSLPALDGFNFDVEAREPPDDILSSFLDRSQHPPITRFSIGYGTGISLFYVGGGIVSWNFLWNMTELQTLQIGNVALDQIVQSLAMPDDESNQWLLPNLVSLAMKNCHSHTDGVSKLVQLIDARNPANGNTNLNVGAGGAAPKRLRKLELYECINPGQDVLAWLKTRIESVICTELSYDRSPLLRSPPFPL